MEHEKFIREAIQLAVDSGKKGNHTFGTALVHQGKIIATAENTEVTGTGYGHTEYNLALRSGQQFSEQVLRECTLYTSTAPCSRCAFAILAIGIKRVAIGVSYETFATLIPEPYEILSIHEIVRRLDLKEVEILGPFLEDEGLSAFEHWGGEYHPLEELLASAQHARERRSTTSQEAMQ